MEPTGGEKALNREVGEELRRAREARGWSRAQFVKRLPSGIGERTVLAYEHGLRHLTTLRLVELCDTLGVGAPPLLTRALQRARIHIENMPLTVDLQALLDSRSGPFRSLTRWARNAMSEHPDRVVDITPDVVENLALFMGCEHGELANYLARFLPDEVTASGRVDPPVTTTLPRSASGHGMVDRCDG